MKFFSINRRRISNDFPKFGFFNGRFLKYALAESMTEAIETKIIRYGLISNCNRPAKGFSLLIMQKQKVIDK